MVVSTNPAYSFKSSINFSSSPLLSAYAPVTFPTAVNSSPRSLISPPLPSAPTNSSLKFSLAVLIASVLSFKVCKSVAIGSFPSSVLQVWNAVET
jgi:hypothetical protein